MAIEMEQVLAFEVLRKKKSRTYRERIGHVVRADSGGEFMWIAYAIISPTGDSFIGSFATPKLAREAIIAAEKELRKGARDETS